MIVTDVDLLLVVVPPKRKVATACHCRLTWGTCFVSKRLGG